MMSNYIGIDLGTTNSAIASFDAEEVRIWKSPREQNDVTPSVIFIDKRGNKHIGKHAYDNAPGSPDNAASLFKRLMGTSTPIQLPAVELTMTPEECSSEILKVLFGYLPEEVRNSDDTGSVITVPAAFNQMQKDATMHAAELAGIGKVALMQEPVAAVMSVMRTRNSDGIFVIYDLGGGTLDVAIAESLGGRVNLLAHGGIAMCGGRDWDRALVDNVVKLWLHDNFDLPEDFIGNPDYKSLIRLAAWATEKAKIELSSSEEVIISLTETEARSKDRAGKEIYLDIPLDRATLDKHIEDRINESIEAARETLTKAGLSANDVERLVFVGGPTNYKPLRDKVSFELGIPGSSDVNPMTAVCEGAALFAESIDWGTQSRGRKGNRGKITSSDKLDVTFNFIARTPDTKAKIAVQVKDEVLEGAEFQVDSLESGWTSGRLSLSDGATVDVTLDNNGENTFKIFVFDVDGGPLSLAEDKIVITRTAATIDAIPASYSIGIEVLEKLGGRPTLDWLIRAGDQLPKKDKRVFKTGESLKSGSAGSINFKLWEGEIEDPITDNRFIGMLKVSGADFDDGVIPAGADLECEYEVEDSGKIVLEVSIPSIGGVFHSGHNFYFRQDGQVDFSEAAARITEESESTTKRLDEISDRVEDPKLEQARKKLSQASEIRSDNTDTERAQESMENILEAKKLLSEVRKDHLKDIRQLDLDQVKQYFDDYIREFARPSEATAFDNLVRTAQREIDRNGKDFENHIDELRTKNFEILWRQDWFVVGRFKHIAETPHNFTDQKRYEELVSIGVGLMQNDDIDKLREVVAQLSMMQIGSVSETEMLDMTNIIRG